MARFSRMRRYGRRARTIVKYVRSRSYRPKKKNTQMLIGLGVLGLIAYINKDKIKTMLSK